MLCRRLVVDPRIPLNPGGTLTTPFLSSSERGFSGCSDRKISSYQERLRSGLGDINKDDAVALFQSMVRSRPLPTVINFSRLFSGIAKIKQYDLVLALCKQMELNGIAHNIYTLSIVINCFCRLWKLGFAFSVVGKMLKLWGRVSEAVELVDRMVDMEVAPDLIILNTIVNGLCLQDRLSDAMALIDRMIANGCQPNEVTYSPVLDRMCKSGNTLIRAHLRGGDLETSAKLIEEMKSCGFSSDASTVKIVMDMLSSGELDKSFLNMLSGPSRDKSPSFGLK